MARRAGKPGAYRAVGNILNKNYDPNIPCHRVVRSDGKPGGYNRGPALKIERLSMEGADIKLPLFITHISAGFPSPADDFIENKLDLNEKLIRHPAATFFVKVEGNSMIKAGIQPGDMLIVDRALEPRSGGIVVAVINGEFTVKRIEKKQNRIYLVPENTGYKPIEITEEMDFKVWGVVTNVIHSV